MNDIIIVNDKDGARSSTAHGCQKEENLRPAIGTYIFGTNEKSGIELNEVQGEQLPKQGLSSQPVAGQRDSRTIPSTLTNGHVLSGETNGQLECCVVTASGEERNGSISGKCLQSSEELREAINSLEKLNHRIDSFRHSSLWRNNPGIRKEPLALNPSSTSSRLSQCEEKSTGVTGTSKRDHSKGVDSRTVDDYSLITGSCSFKSSGERNGVAARTITLELGVQMIQDLLLDTQRQCAKMVNENQRTAAHFDDELGQCQSQMDALRKDLAYANRCVSDLEVNAMINGSATESDNELHSTEHRMEAEIYRLRQDNARLRTQFGALHRELLIERQATVDSNCNPNSLPSENLSLHCQSPPAMLVSGGRASDQRSAHNSDNSLNASVENNDQKGNNNKANEFGGGKPASIADLQLELIQAKEALIALKHDRKRLKAEKVELLNQMKEVYQTLEAKERELRDFIRQFEQKMRESDKGIKELIWEKEKLEKERRQLTETLEKANEKTEQLKLELEKERVETSKLQAQLKELQGRFLLITGQQPQIVPSNSNSDPAAAARADPPAGETPGSAGYASLAATPATIEQTLQNHVREATPSKNVGCSPYKANFTPEEAAMLRRRPKHPDVTHQDDNKRQSRLLQDNSSPLAATDTYYEDTGTAVGGTQSTFQHLALLRRARSSGRKSQDKGETSPGSQGRPSSGSGAGNRLSRLFHFASGAAGRSKSKETPHKNKNIDLIDRSSSAFAMDAIAADLNLVEKADQLLQARQIPMARWRQSHLLAWLELELGMCAYTTKFVDNVKSGKVLLTLTDHEIESVLVVGPPLHRKKLRLAIEEYRAPALCKFPSVKEVTNQYVCRQWLPSLGLSQYTPSFRQQLIDGRLLNYLNKKQLDKYLGVSRRFHQLSILKGIELLRLFHFDVKSLAKRRVECERENVELLVWTNQRLGKWCEQIDLGEYADNLRESGIHGGLCVLDPSFTIETLATALGIPSGRQMVRKHLAAEFLPLLDQARTQIENDHHHRKGHRSGGSLGRAFSRSYTISGDQDFASSAAPDSANQRLSGKRRRNLRGSIGRVFGLRVRRSTGTTCSNDDNLLNDEVSPARSSTVAAHLSLNSGDIVENRNAISGHQQHNSNTPANASSPKPLNRSTGTLSSTTSDLGSSIERSQHMKTILGTPKVLTQPPLTSMISSTKATTTGPGHILNSSLSDASGLSRLQHLCLSPGEVLSHGGATSNSRNPLVRLRNKARSGAGDVPRMGLSGVVDTRSPGSAPARPHSVGDFGGLSNYYNGPNLATNGGGVYQNAVEKKTTVSWWKAQSRTTEGVSDVSFSPRKLQTWLSAEHFSSNGNVNVKTNLDNVQHQSAQNGHEKDQHGNEAHNGSAQQQYAMGTIAEQGEPMESENESHSQENSLHCNCNQSRAPGKQTPDCQTGPRRKTSLGREEASRSRSSSSSISPSRRDRPNSLPLRAQAKNTSNQQIRHVSSSTCNECGDRGKLCMPPLASVDSIHETDL